MTLNFCLVALVFVNFLSESETMAEPVRTKLDTGFEICLDKRYSNCVVCPAHWYTACPSGYTHVTTKYCGFLGCKLECYRAWEHPCSDCTKPCPTPRPTQEPTSNPTATPTRAPTTFPTVEPTDSPTTLRPTCTPTFVPSISPSHYPTSDPTSELEHCTSVCAAICRSFDENARLKCEDAYVDQWVAQQR